MTYDEFRTGLTFREVRSMMRVGGDDSSRWRQLRRHSVLGFWRELKLAMWHEFWDRSRSERRQGRAA